MSGGVRIRIDRLVIDAATGGPAPAALEAALHRALAGQLASAGQARSRHLPEVGVAAASGSADGIAGAVAKAVARSGAGGR
jgi:hypothetical protein